MKESVEERMTKQKHKEEKLQSITQKEHDLMKCSRDDCKQVDKP